MTSPMLPESPFGAPLGNSGRALRWALYVGAPLVAVVLVFLYTRQPPSPLGTPDGLSQTPTPATADSAVPVMLTAQAAERIGVTYTTATVGPLQREVRTVGQVTFDETRVKAIDPKIDGWVERLDVDYTGMQVRTGDPLFTIYSPMLVSAQEELLLAKRLVRDVGGGTPEASRGAEELVQSARRRLSYWDIPERDIDQIEQSGVVQRVLTLRSPVAGVVVEKAVLSGQKIMAGETIYRIADLSVVWVEGEVFEQDIPAVRVGLQVTAEFEALPGERIVGRIAYLYPTLNSETRTARVRVEVMNPALRLKPGMYATLRFLGGGSGNVLSVPRSATLSTGARTIVFVRRADGKLEPREVSIGFAGVDRVQVLSGLSAGETVVASATFLVDAESNLGSALGGMGNMPGMDMTLPTKNAAPARPPVPPVTARPPDPRPKMPGMTPPPRPR